MVMLKLMINSFSEVLFECFNCSKGSLLLCNFNTFNALLISVRILYIGT